MVIAIPRCSAIKAKTSSDTAIAVGDRLSFITGAERNGQANGFLLISRPAR